MKYNVNGCIVDPVAAFTGSSMPGPPADRVQDFVAHHTAVLGALEVLGFSPEGLLVTSGLVIFSTRRFTLAQIDLVAEVFGTRRIDFADGPYSFTAGGLVDVQIYDPQLPKE